MSRDQNEITRARFRMALWLLIFFFFTLAEGALTFSFVGHTSSTQNVIYGIIVASPFWISILVFLFVVRRDAYSKKDE